MGPASNHVAVPLFFPHDALKKLVVSLLQPYQPSSPSLEDNLFFNAPINGTLNSFRRMNVSLASVTSRRYVPWA